MEVEKWEAGLRTLRRAGDDQPILTLGRTAKDCDLRSGNGDAPQRDNRTAAYQCRPKQKSCPATPDQNGSARGIPLSSTAVEVLKSLAEQESGLCFKSRPDTITKAFAEAVSGARLAYTEGLRLHLKQNKLSQEKIDLRIHKDLFLFDLRFHDLRHEATSRLAEIFPLHELTKITGHQDTRMLMRYYHPRTEDLAKKLT